jgi:hypothetical protein
MKYIRTKYGIIYEEYAREKCPNGCVIATNTVRIPYADILCEADTIEELCDMFVVINDDWGKEPYCCTYVEIKLYKNLKTKGKVYGAIWTDKGLIYVAKMNDKGELELL